MSSIREFLYGIAVEMGRPKESMDSVIKIFDDNWYDTVESIKDLDEEALAKMKLPLRIIELIRKKLGGSKPQPTESQKMVVEEEKKTNTSVSAPSNDEIVFLNHQLSKATQSLELLKRETITPQNLLEVVTILEKVIGNLIKDPANETFRTLKLTNEKLKEKFFAFPSVLDILALIGFNNKGDVLYIQQNEINLTFTKQLLKDVENLKRQTLDKQAFDPYKSSFGTTTNDINVANLVSQGGPSNYDYVQKLDELKQKRWDAVKSYIEDKEVKVFKLEPNTSIQSFLTTRDQEMEEEEEDPTSAEYLFKKEILKWAKEFEDSQQFTSRRKKEFEQLLHKPLFIESRVRVRFPNNTILEAKFSPKEPVKNVVDLVKKYLVDPNWNFYLYQTPPVQRITLHNWNKSLEDADMVPNSLLYFGTDQPLEGVQDYLTIKPQ